MRATVRLTAREVEAARPQGRPYKLSDGEGLYLFVSPAGAKSWRANYTLDGKQKTRTYGQFPEVGLADARALHRAARSSGREVRFAANASVFQPELVPVAPPVEAAPGHVPLAEGVTHLYKHFDAQGRLLYVGISLSALARLAEHKRSEWFWSIARIEVQAYTTRRQALEAERLAIQCEHPLHNIIHAVRS